jgi:hypothetical protein
MPVRIWGPLTVIGVFTLAGALVGADIALFPWDDPISLPIPVTIGLIVGFLSGAFIVWTIRQVEQLN